VQRKVVASVRPDRCGHPQCPGEGENADGTGFVRLLRGVFRVLFTLYRNLGGI